MSQYTQYRFIEDGDFPEGDLFSHCEAWADVQADEKYRLYMEHEAREEQIRRFVENNPYCSTWSRQEQEDEMEMADYYKEAAEDEWLEHEADMELE